MRTWCKGNTLFKVQPANIMEIVLKTTVTNDYVEVALTGNPCNKPQEYKNPNSVLENLYTGTVVDTGFGVNNLTKEQTVGKTIVFAKLFTIRVDSTETKYYCHRNAIVAVVD